jgi:hypothetical protein
VAAGDVFVGAHLSGPHVVTPDEEDGAGSATNKKSQGRKGNTAVQEHRRNGQQPSKAIPLGSKR